MTISRVSLDSYRIDSTARVLNKEGKVRLQIHSAPLLTDKEVPEHRHKYISPAPPVIVSK